MRCGAQRRRGFQPTRAGEMWSRTGPPLFPGLMAASNWIASRCAAPCTYCVRSCGGEVGRWHCERGSEKNRRLCSAERGGLAWCGAPRG